MTAALAQILQMVKIAVLGLTLRGGNTLLSSAAKLRLVFLEMHPDFLPRKEHDASLIIDLLKKTGTCC